MAPAQQNHIPQPNTTKLESSPQNLAGEGFRLSLLLNAAACHIAQSGIEIHSIAKGVSLFSLALKELGLAIHDGPRDSGSSLSHSRSAADKIWEIASQGERILNEIGGMLEKLKATESVSGVSLQQRVKWCFKRHHVTYLLAQLEMLKLSLVVVLQVLRLGKLVNHTKRSPKPGTDEVIAQDKAEVQNMIIVRHYAAKRLNRLWELVEQENFEAEHDQENQLINSHYHSPSTSTKQTKLPIPSLGDSGNDQDLGSAMARTPKDMVQLSERILNQLLESMVRDSPTEDSSSSAGSPNTQRTRKVHFSSDSGSSDGSLDLDSDSHGVRGYYLEGTTTDWRKPHSQEARQHAARLRKKYEPYQAHVESDSDGSESEPRSPRESPNTDDDVLGFSDEEDFKRKTTAQSIPKGGAVMGRNTSSTRNSPQSFDGRQSLYPPGYYNGPSSYPRAQHQQQQQQPYQQYQPYQSYPQQGHGTSHSMPVGIPSGYPHRGIPGQLESQKQTSSPRFNNPELQPERFSPAPLYSSNTNRSYKRSPSRQKSPRENTKTRNKSLADGATKGLVGVGAIAGFMDALEAFSGL